MRIANGTPVVSSSVDSKRQRRVQRDWSLGNMLEGNLKDYGLPDKTGN
jgi:hypothetical protein